MARAVIRKPETPSFVLTSPVRVADWDQVYGTHQGQWLQRMPRLKAPLGRLLRNRLPGNGTTGLY